MKAAVFCVSVILVLAGTLRTHAAVVANSSRLSLSAIASIGDVVDNDIDTATQFGAIDPQSVSVEAQVVAPSSSVRTFGDATATWDHPAKGQVTFVVGWETVNALNSGADLSSTDNAWVYRFTSDLTGTLNIAYDVAFDATDDFGLNGFGVYFDGLDISPTAVNPDTSPNLLTVPVTAAVEHEIRIFPGANISGGLLTRTATMTGNFDWEFVSVPEPGSLCILLPALMLSIAWRRRAVSGVC